MKSRSFKITLLLISVALPLSIVGFRPMSDEAILSQKRALIQDLKERHLAIQRSIADLNERFLSLEDAFESERDTRIYDPANVCEGRLTTQTSVALSITDQAEVATLFYTPYNGSECSLLNGSSVWQFVQFSQVSIALASVVSGSNYDVFAYNNSGTVALELSTAWKTSNVRNDALVSVNGVLVKNADNTRRYLGTIRGSTTAGHTIDSSAQRYVWNYQNRLPRFLYVKDATNSWTYATNGWRSADNSANNKVQYVVGVDKTLGADEPLIKAKTMAVINGTTAGEDNFYASGIGIDTTALNSAEIMGSGGASGMFNQVWGEFSGYPAQGFHILNWLERGTAGGYTIWGDNGSTAIQSGMLVEIEG